jgi:nucleoside-diphosphate-sugar epimerase
MCGGEMIAITGSQTGFLSSNLLKALPDAVSIPRGVRKEFFPLTGWILQRRPTCVIHCAGLADVRMCMQYPREAFRVNTVDTMTLIEALAGSGIPLIYVATDKVFGSQEGCGTFAPYQPISAYDVSKVAAEMIVEEFARTNRCVIARFPNFYGPGDPHKERLFPSVVDAIKRKDATFAVRTSVHSARQYIFMPDVVKILDALTLYVKQGGSRFKHHFGTPHVKSVFQVICDLSSVFGHFLGIEEQHLDGEASQLSINLDTDIPVEFTSWEKSLESFK